MYIYGEVRNYANNENHSKVLRSVGTSKELLRMRMHFHLTSCHLRQSTFVLLCIFQFYMHTNNFYCPVQFLFVANNSLRTKNKIEKTFIHVQNNNDAIPKFGMFHRESREELRGNKYGYKYNGYWLVTNVCWSLVFDDH